MKAKKCRISKLLMVVSVIAILPLQAQFDGHLRLLGDWNNTPRIMALENGGFIAMDEASGVNRTQLFGPDGSPLWGVLGQRLLGISPDGRAAFLANQGINGTIDEGYTFHVELSAFDGTLQALWSKRLIFDLGDLAPFTYGGAEIARWGEAGDLFLAVDIEQVKYIVHIPADAQPGWAYRIPSLADLKLANDGNGGCFVAGRSLSYPSEGVLEVMHLQHDGTVGFHRTYTMNDWFFTQPKNVQYAAGELTVIIDHSARGAVLVLDAEGDVLSYDKYAPLPAAPANTPFGVWGGLRQQDGTYIILGGIAGLQAKSMALRLNVNREPLEARSMNTVVMNNVRKGIFFQDAASVDDGLVVAGLYTEWDEVFNSPVVNWPVVWRFNGPLDDLCKDSEIQFAHVSVPPESVTIEERTSIQAMVEVSEVPGVILDQIAAWGTQGFCAQFVGVDGPSGRLGHDLFTIANTVVQPGAPLTIKAHSELRLQVVNSAGQTVHWSMLHKDETRMLEEPTWSSGVYHLLGIDQYGRRQGLSILVHDR